MIPRYDEVETDVVPQTTSSVISSVMFTPNTMRPFKVMLVFTTILTMLLHQVVMAHAAASGGGRNQMYFALAASASAASVNGQLFTRAFNKTLTNMTQAYHLAHNVTVEPLLIELPDDVSVGFSEPFLRYVCSRFERRHVVAVFIVGNSRAAFTVALAAGHAGVPVLWARGTNTNLPGLNNLELSSFEVYLEPTARELMEALRSLFIQTHWHSFTILADESVVSSVLLRRELVTILEEPPLRPTIVRLPATKRPQALFRRLADVSRSTRGVVILMCDRLGAGRVLDQARRLNMVDGHFVWLWIDTEPANISPDSGAPTATTTERPPRQRDRREIPSSFESSKSPSIEVPNIPREKHKNTVVPTKSATQEMLFRTTSDSEHERRLRRHREIVKRDISDMNINYLLKNDQFLMFNRDESSVKSAGNPVPNPGGRKNRERRPPTGSSATPLLELSSTREPPVYEGVPLPAGLLSIRAVPMRVDKHVVRGAVRLLIGTLRAALARCPPWLAQSIALDHLETSCWAPASATEFNFSTVFARELRAQCTDALAGKKLLQENGIEKIDKSLVSSFEISNLVPEFPVDAEATAEDAKFDNNIENNVPQKLKWKTVGLITGRTVNLDTIVWPGGGVVVAGLSSQARSVFRVVTALAPPFVMESGLDEDGQCLRGLPCHRVLTSDKDNLTLVFNDMNTQERLEEDEEENPNDLYEHNLPLPLQRFKYRTNCCYGLAMDLLENVAHELQFDFRLYIVADGLFGTRTVTNSTTEHEITKRDVGKAYLNYRRQDGIFKDMKHQQVYEELELEEDLKNAKWNGVVGDLVSGAAHMSFGALSVSSQRSVVIDYSTPFFYSSVSFLAAPQQKSEIPLMAFLLPFSPELWIAIFTSLNITAIAVACYEWLSPFGLNPWGRQRSKNFSMSSALWVMWGLLCGHLVAFKAPKSWPNKFLINVWGGFSVIFVASYTANIAALIAGLFFQNTVSNYHDRSLLSQKVGAPRASAAEYYVKRANKLLWDHMHRFSLDSVEDGIERLRNGSLDILIADTPILDYYRATDHGCTLQKIGDSINEDTYAVGMAKGFPLKDSISSVIAKYAANGYMDILQEKWYGGLPCFKLQTEIAQPRPLGVAAVTGVFILLGVGMFMGILILLVEHLFYRYTLPILRHKPKGTIWRSRNIMFFSQKLYRFINCVELVSPHHAARELVHTLRQGQITSLFQKSVKRKEHEQRRRRKSKAQFFEMIQEIRRQQQEVRQQPPLASLTEVDQEYQNSPEDKRERLSPNIIRRTFMRSSPKIETPTKMKSPVPGFGSLFSPRSKAKARSQTALNVRRFSTDSVFNSNSSQTLKLDRSSAIGRRLSKDATFLSSSPPDINSRRSSYLDIINSSSKLSGKSPVLSIENVSECESIGKKFGDHKRKFSDAENIGRKLATLPKNFNSNAPAHPHLNTLFPNDRLNINKSEEVLSKTDNSPNYGTMRVNDIITAKSYQNICDGGNNSQHNTKITNHTGRNNKKELEVEIDDPYQNNVSDDEIARRNKKTIDQLKIQLTRADTGKPLVMRSQSNNVTSSSGPSTTTNPSIRIQIEDTSTSSTSKSSSSRSVERRVKHRHRSLGEAPPPRSPLPPEPSTKRHLRGVEQTRSLDGNPQGGGPVPQVQVTHGAPQQPPQPLQHQVAVTSSRSRAKCREHDLPPAPPPPNCSPRNSNGRSPLERLSKDELVNLWRSSESELRSHLLKAIRDKDADDPP